MRRSYRAGQAIRPGKRLLPVLGVKVNPPADLQRPQLDGVVLELRCHRGILAAVEGPPRTRRSRPRPSSPGRPARRPRPRPAGGAPRPASGCSRCRRLARRGRRGVGCVTGAAAGPERYRSVWRELADGDARGRGAGGQRERGRAQFGQVVAVDGERADLGDPALIDVQEAAVGAEPGVDGADPAGGPTGVLPSRVSVPPGAIW